MSICQSYRFEKKLSGCTTNPPLSWQAIWGDPNYWNEQVGKRMSARNQEIAREI